jgi:hypothetical protein
MVELHCQWSPRLRTSVRSGWRAFSGIEVDGAQDSSWRRCCFARLYLAAKPSHVGIDVDRLAYSMHRPMVRGHEMRGQSFMSGASLSHRATVGVCAFLRVAKPPGLDI